MEALITGGRGFLGEAMRRLSSQLGLQTHSFDWKDGNDILCRRQVREALRGKTHCVHLAAVADLYDAKEDGAGCRRINVEGTEIVAEECAGLSVKLLFASTACIYGNNGEKRQSENSPISPTEIYAQTKAEAEETLKGIPALDYRIVRPATFYGPGMRDTLAVARCLNACLTGESFRIFGDGTQTRAYTYVDDIAWAILILLKEWPNEIIFNASSSESVSVHQLADICERITGADLRRDPAPERLGEIRQSSIDCTRLLTLGWTPTTQLESGIRKCLAVVKSPPVLESKPFFAAPGFNRLSCQPRRRSAE